MGHCKRLSCLPVHQLVDIGLLILWGIINNAARTFIMTLVSACFMSLGYVTLGVLMAIW